jgi:2-polyprenyl-3-methyl-5-hydroxy-6-metoxy-1,4-benzoquinol methylase
MRPASPHRTLRKGLARVIRWRFRPAFSGTWEDRLHGLFDCEVEFAGKRVLDAGCNMGVILYEVSKQRPAFIHGIDRYRRAITVAQRIFSAIKIPHRYDTVDFFNDQHFVALLEPSYDIVLLMAVWQHVYLADKKKAELFLKRLAERCREALIFRGSEEWGEHFAKAIAPHGFVVAHRGTRPSQEAGPILVFRASTSASVAKAVA